MKPRPLYFLLSFVTSILFSMIFMASSIYEASIAHLQPYQLVLVGTVLEVSILIFEIPTGVLADTKSRKLSVILGFFLIGCGFLLEGSIPVFAPILAAQVIAGLGFTFISGATTAWLTDEIGEYDANNTLLQANKFELGGSLLGLGLATWIGASNITLPLLVGSALMMFFSLILIGLMSEHGFSPTQPEDRSTIQHAWSIFTESIETVRQHPQMMTILGVGLMYGLYSEGWDRLWVKFILDRFDTQAVIGISPVVFFGLLRASGMLLSIGVTFRAEKRIDAGSTKAISQAMLWITGLLAISIAAYPYSISVYMAGSLFLVVSVARNLSGPLYTAWINNKLPSKTRATILSISSQVDAVGQVMSGPLAAAISLFSLPAAITFAGLLLTPALPLIKRVDHLSVDEL